jgi:Tfp pilus assembly protein PilF
MHDAIALAEHGDQQRALQIVAVILREHPAFLPALKLQGMILEDTGSTQAATQSYTAALKLAPSDPDLLLKVGIADLVQGDSSHAVVFLSKRAKLLPRDSEGLYYLAQAYHRSSNDDLALQTIRRASQLDPKSAPIAQKYGELLCSSGDNVHALTWLTKAQRADPTLPRIEFDLAVASYNNLDLDRAVEYAIHETEAQPADVEAFALLASARVKLAQWSAAEPLLEHVLATRPADPALLLQLGHCQLELHHNEAAVDTLRRALQADPTQPLAHFFLSRAYAGLGRADDARHEAELHQRMMQEVSFEVPKAQQIQEAQLREQARALLAANHEDEALKLFARNSGNLGATPGSPYLAVGATYLSMANTGAAKRALEHSLQIDPKTKGAHTYLGVMYLEQGDLPRAEQAFQAELAIDPNHPFALAEMGEVRYRQSKWAEAINYFLRSKTNLPRFLYMLTDAYFHASDTKAANLTAESLAAYAHDQKEILTGLNELLQQNGQIELANRIRQY